MVTQRLGTTFLFIFLFLNLSFSQTFTRTNLNKNDLHANLTKFQDYDSDGDLDIILVQVDTPAIWWLENDSTFQWPRHLIENQNVSFMQDLVIVDMDGDEDMDYLICSANYNQDDGELFWLERKADDTYEKWTIAPGETFDQAVIGDFIGDDNLDVVAIGFDRDRVSLYEGDGFFFSSGITVADSVTQGTLLEAGFIDDDNTLDIVIGSSGVGTTGSRIMYNNGNGTFITGQPLINYINFSSLWHDMELIDLDGNSSLDIIGFRGVATGNLQFYNGSTGFDRIEIDDECISPCFGADIGGGLVVFDVDQNGLLDIVRQHTNSNGDANRLSVLYQTATLEFEKVIFEENMDILTGTEMDYGDIDGDGDDDLVVCDNYAIDGDVAIYENIDGKLIRHQIYGELRGAYIPKYADIDNDGDQDILLSVNADIIDEDEIILYENIDGTNFKSWRINDAIALAWDIEPAYIDTDSMIDIFATANEANTLVWLHNDSTKYDWQSDTIDASLNEPRGISSGFIDQDDFVDVAACSYNDEKVFWYSNNGNGSFNKRIMATSLQNPMEVELAHLNDDEFLDAVVISEDTAFSVTILMNDGTNSFDKETILSGIDVRDVEVGDWNADGYIDILVGVYTYPNSAEDVLLLSNDGVGNFTSTTLVEIQGFANAINLTDLDGDGDLDLLIGMDHFSFWGPVLQAAFNENGETIRIEPMADYDIGTILGIAIGDVDNDQVVDIIYTDGRSEDLFLLKPLCLDLPNLTIEEEIECTDRTLTAAIDDEDGMYSYFWSSGDTTASLSLTSLDFGDYRVTVTTADGCTLEAETFLPEIPNFEGFPNIVQPNCETATGSIEIFLSGGTEPYSYQWSTGDTTALLENLPPGNYSVTASDPNGCLVTGQFELIAPEIPVVDLGEDLSIAEGQSVELIPAISVPPAGYLWNTGETTPTITVSTAGNYSVVVTSNDGCTGSDVVSVTVITSVEENALSKQIEVSPNPSSEQIQIQLGTAFDLPIPLEVVDMKGSVLLSIILKNTNSSLDISILPAGTYALRFNTKQGQALKRIIKQ